MKESHSSQSARTPLGYLVAFTLGIICMGAIMYFIRAQPPAQPAEPKMVTVDEPTTDTAPEPQQNVFGTRIRTTRSDSGNPANFPVLDVTATDESASSRPDDQFNSNQYSPAVINRHVSVAAVADRQFDAAIPQENTRVSGRSILVGPRPQERVIAMDPWCARKHPGPVTTRFFVTGKDNGLADVLVVITAGLPQQLWAVPRQPVTLRLRNCIYENHIVGLQAGQQLLVANLDNGLHNVHPMPSRKGNPEANFAMLPKAPPLSFNFSQPERFLRFKCDVHPWEFAYVNVIDHPFFAVTDANGNFTIEGLPPGDYTLEAHHRKAGIVQKQITVQRHRNTTIDFQFTATPPPAQEI